MQAQPSPSDCMSTAGKQHSDPFASPALQPWAATDNPTTSPRHFAPFFLCPFHASEVPLMIKHACSRLFAAGWAHMTPTAPSNTDFDASGINACNSGADQSGMANIIQAVPGALAGWRVGQNACRPGNSSAVMAATFHQAKLSMQSSCCRLPYGVAVHPLLGIWGCATTLTHGRGCWLLLRSRCIPAGVLV